MYTESEFMKVFICVVVRLHTLWPPEESLSVECVLEWKSKVIWNK